MQHTSVSFLVMLFWSNFYLLNCEGSKYPAASLICALSLIPSLTNWITCRPLSRHRHPPR